MAESNMENQQMSGAMGDAAEGLDPVTGTSKPGEGTAFEEAYPAQNEAVVGARDDTTGARFPDTAGGVRSPAESPGAMPDGSPQYEVLSFERDESPRARHLIDSGRRIFSAVIHRAGSAVDNTKETIRSKRYDISPKKEAAAAGVTALAIGGTIKWVRGHHRGHRPYNTPHMPSLPHLPRMRRNRNAVMRHLPDRLSRR